MDDVLSLQELLELIRCKGRAIVSVNCVRGPYWAINS